MKTVAEVAHDLLKKFFSEYLRKSANIFILEAPDGATDDRVSIVEDRGDERVCR